MAGAILSVGGFVTDRGVLDDVEDEVGEDSVDDFGVGGEMEGGVS